MGSKVRAASASVLTVVVLAVLTTVDYFVFLGWDQAYDVDPEGVVTGPYQAWQVVGLCFGLVALAAGAAWHGHSTEVVVVIPAVMGVFFVVDAATDAATYGATLWPIGAAMVMGGTWCGAVVVTRLVRSVGAYRRH